MLMGNMRSNSTHPESNQGSALSRQFAWVGLGLVWASVIFALREHVLLVVESWEKLPSHAHGYVVLAVVAYFSWKKRHILRRVSFAPSYVGMVFFLLSGAAAYVGELVSAAVVAQFAVVFMLIGSTWAVLGYQAFRNLLGPLSFLFFAIPFGHDILPTLMDWTANATVAGLRASGIPVLQQDRHFVIPSGSWSVIEACSGIRYLFTSFFVGSIFAYLTYQRWYKRLVFIAAMVLLSLFANWLRAYAIVLIAHLTDNQWGLGLSHLAFGWVIFGVVVITAFMIGDRWRDPPPVGDATPQVRQTALPRIMAAALLTSAIAFGWRLGPANMVNHVSIDPLPLQLDLSQSLGKLPTVQPGLAMLEPSFIGATAIHQGDYLYAGEVARIYLAYYRNQKQGQELVNVKSQIESSKTWEWRGNRKLHAISSLLPSLKTEKYTHADTVALATTLYWVGGYITQSEVRSKFFQAFNLLRGQGDDGAAIVISVSAHTEEEASPALEALIRDLLPSLLSDLEQTMQQTKRLN